MDQAEIDAFKKQLRGRLEAESLKYYGPPEVRAEKNREYINQLKSQYSEQAIRGILVALSLEESPMCVTFLRDDDLAAASLETIIRQFEFGGFRFSISDFDEEQYTVKVAMTFWEEGDGATFVVGRDGDGFRVLQKVRQFIC